MWTALRIIGTALLAAAGLLIATSLSSAADGTTVTIPYGEWIASVGDAAASLLLPILLGVLARVMTILPAPIAAMLTTARVEQLLDRAINYGINAVRGATAGKVLTVDVGNKVIAQAADYAIDAAPSLVKWMGGEEALRRKILARLPMTEDASIFDLTHAAPPIK